MKKIILSLTLLLATLGFSQVLIDDTGATSAMPDPSAALEVKSADKGLLVPRLANESAITATPVEGLIFFDQTENCFKGYNGTEWQALSDCTPVPTTDYTISIADATAVTEGTDQTFVVTIDPALVAGDVITVDYTSADGTATAGADYTATSGTLTFNTGGQSTQDIIVSTTDDTDTESAENYTVTLSNAGFTGSGTATIGTSSATGTINDNDGTPPVACKTDLLITEYVEGSSNNKYIELYNGTGSDIDLSEYKLNHYNNGSSSITYSLTLSGNLSDGQTIVIANNSATIYTGSTFDTNSNVMTFNGNDVVSLTKGGTTIDIFGTIGDSSNFGKDKTFARSATSTPSATFNSSEWTELAKDDVSGLGSYTCE